MKYKNKNFRAFQTGFTLIELLIVIAIIGILASIVLVSLSEARTKSRISANEAEARQLVSLLQLQWSDTGSYTGLVVNSWVPGSYTCDSVPLSGNHVAQYRAICNSVMNRLGSGSPTHNWFVGDSTGTGNSFSVMIKTSGGTGTSGTWFCIGSSGQVYEGAYNTNGPGCYGNP